MENVDQRLSVIHDKSRHMAAAGRETAGDAARLFRDILEERPLLVIGTIAVASDLISRCGSIRALGTAAKLGRHAAELAGVAGGV
jgi:hypothetical protein